MNNRLAPSISLDGACAFLCDQFGTGEPVVAVRRAVCHLLATSAPRVPVDIEPLARARGILGWRQADVPVGVQILLVPVARGFELVVPKTDRRNQGRLFADVPKPYVYAHEIMETFFFSAASPKPVHWSHLPRYRGLATDNSFRPGGSEERLCDFGENLILIPKREVEALTDAATKAPRYAALKDCAKNCRVGELNVCHRVACFLSAVRGRHSVVGIARKSSNPRSPRIAKAEWRFHPSGNSDIPVAVDIEATLNHGFSIWANQSIKNLGFEQLAKWLEGGGQGQAPIGEHGLVVQNGLRASMELIEATYDTTSGNAVLWFEVHFAD